MIKIKCDCGTLVCEGDYLPTETKNGSKKKFFGKIKEGYSHLREMKMNGEIIKNKSNNPKDWSGVCSKCQKDRDKK